MRRFVASAFVAGLVLASVGCGTSKQGVVRKPSTRQRVSLPVAGVRAGRGPFVPTGALYAVTTTNAYWAT